MGIPNPWYQPRNSCSRPTLELTRNPSIYRGYEIHNRPCDYLVVKDGVALTMCHGPNGARCFIDKTLAATTVDELQG